MEMMAQFGIPDCELIRATQFATQGVMKIVVDASCCAGSTPFRHREALDILRSCQVEIVNDEWEEAMKRLHMKISEVFHIPKEILEHEKCPDFVIKNFHMSESEE